MAMLIQEMIYLLFLSTKIFRKQILSSLWRKKVFESSISTLNDTKKLLHKKDLKKAATIINESKRVYFFGLAVQRL